MVRQGDRVGCAAHDTTTFATAASLAVSARPNVKAVQRMLGHASAAMTLDIYADLFDDDLEVVATALHDARLRENAHKTGNDPAGRVASKNENRHLASQKHPQPRWARRVSNPSLAGLVETAEFENI